MSETKVGEHEFIGHMVTKITCCHLDNSQIHLVNLRRVTRNYRWGPFSVQASHKNEIGSGIIYIYEQM